MPLLTLLNCTEREHTGRDCTCYHGNPNFWWESGLVFCAQNGQCPRPRLSHPLGCSWSGEGCVWVGILLCP